MVVCVIRSRQKYLNRARNVPLFLVVRYSPYGLGSNVHCGRQINQCYQIGAFAGVLFGLRLRCWPVRCYRIIVFACGLFVLWFRYWPVLCYRIVAFACVLFVRQ